MSEATPLEKKATALITIEGPEYLGSGQWPRQERHTLFEVRFEGNPDDLMAWLAAVLDQLSTRKEETP